MFSANGLEMTYCYSRCTRRVWDEKSRNRGGGKHGQIVKAPVCSKMCSVYCYFCFTVQNDACAAFDAPRRLSHSSAGGGKLLCAHLKSHFNMWTHEMIVWHRKGPVVVQQPRREEQVHWVWAPVKFWSEEYFSVYRFYWFCHLENSMRFTMR